MSNKQEFEIEYGDLLNLATKSWDLPRYGIIGWNPASPNTASVQVSMKGEIDKDSLYYVINGFIYELDVTFLKPDLLDESRYNITEFEKIVKGSLKAIKVPFKYLTKIDIDNINKKKEEKLVTEQMSDKAMNDLMLSWKPTTENKIKEVCSVKTIESIPMSKSNINRLLTKEDFIQAIAKHTEDIKNSLLSKRDKYSPDNWDSLFRKTAMRKQKSVLSVCDGFLDKDLERYYDLLNLLSQNDNVSDEYNENVALQVEVEEVMNCLTNWFTLQKLQMLKQIRAKV